MRRFFEAVSRSASLDESTQEAAWTIMNKLEDRFRTYSQNGEVRGAVEPEGGGVGRDPVATLCRARAPRPLPQEVRKSWALRAAVAIFASTATAPAWNGIWFTQILKSCEVR